VQRAINKMSSIGYIFVLSRLGSRLKPRIFHGKYFSSHKGKTFFRCVSPALAAGRALKKVCACVFFLPERKG
ncbi:hypothetical protein, partial [Desulfovibrio sp. SGI.169]|uniref:hypothetical protein n=1 Tax=Desulfovibrio sp. SGI.169 TaxID=3420561 RepID=UPI003D04BA15